MESLKEQFNNKDKFCIGVELVNTRGIISQDNSDKKLNLINSLSENPDLDWFSITDSAGGNPTMSPDFLAEKLLAKNKNVVIHITCKDHNRNGLESIAWKYASKGFENLLAITGDYPVEGYSGLAQPVFDLDSVSLIKMLDDMNKGLKVNGRKPGSFVQLDKTNFFTGCAVSPFKYSEAEQMMQYEKLKLKINSGAEYIISQLGYNIRKSHELISYLKKENINVPLIGYSYLLSNGVANIFNKGVIPGCVVSDELLKKVRKEKNSPDKGKAFFIDFAARQIAAFKAMGYQGAYLGGINKYEDFIEIIKKSKQYSKENYLNFIKDMSYPLKNEFYFFQKDKKTGLSDVKNINPEYLKQRKPLFSKYVTPLYRFSRLVHKLFFDYNAPFFNFSKGYYKIIEKKHFSALNRLSYFNERFWKRLLFKCKECGDCSLPDITYLCPMSQCEKNQRNGPCGGSLKNKCEVTKTGRDCIWVKAYYRNKRFNGNDEGLLNRKAAIINNELKDTSSWANCFMLRDHNAYKGIKKSKKK